MLNKNRHDRRGGRRAVALSTASEGKEGSIKERAVVRRVFNQFAWTKRQSGVYRIQIQRPMRMSKKNDAVGGRRRREHCWSRTVAVQTRSWSKGSNTTIHKPHEPQTGVLVPGRHVEMSLEVQWGIEMKVIREEYDEKWQVVDSSRETEIVRLLFQKKWKGA